MKEKAINYFKNGYSCSESIIQTAVDEGLCSPDLLSCATPFCAGMMSGCVCGSVAASQMVIGYNYGRDNKFNNDMCAKEKAKEFVERFKERNKVTCCKVLRGGLEGPARKERCSKYVADSWEILEDLVKVKVK